MTPAHSPDMDHLALPTFDNLAAGVPFVVATGVAFALALIAGVIWARREDKAGARAAALVFFSLLVTTIALSLGAPIASDISSTNERSAVSARLSSYASSIEDRYGLDLSDIEVRDLEFPDAKPTEEKPFGTVTLRDVSGGQLTTTDVTLIWDGTGYALVSNGDDGSWTELPTR